MHTHTHTHTDLHRQKDNTFMTEVMYKGKTGCHPDLQEETYSQQKDVFKGNRLSDSQKNGTFTTEVMCKRKNRL